MADNPLLFSDFIKPDDSILKLIDQLEKADATYSKLNKKLIEDAKELEAATKKKTSATDDGKKAIQEATQEAEKLVKANEQLKKSQSENALQLTKLKAQQQEQNKINKLTVKLNESLEGSYDKLSAQYSLNKIALNKMSKEERSATKEGKELEAQTADLYEEMKRLQEATGKHSLDVGNYEKSNRNLRGELEQMPGATGAVVGGFGAMGDAAKKFMANPVVLVIAAIVGGLYALFNLFKKTKTGSDLLNKGMAVVSGTISALVGLVDSLYNTLVSVFEDPKQAMKDFGDFLISQVVNRFYAVINLAKAAGKAITALAKVDMEKLKEAASDAGTALIQMNTGLDEEQQKAFGEALDETTKKIEKQAKAFLDLEETRLALRRSNRFLERSIEALITKEELLKAVSDDATKSFKEREDAAKEAAKLTIQRADVQKKIARENLALIDRELKLRQANGEDVEDLLDRQLDQYKTLSQAERDSLLARRDNEKTLSELKQDRLEKDLDILIDGFDNQKTINEKIIADDTRTLDERSRLLDETKKLSDDSFNEQIKTIEQFTDKQLNANELINESDAVALNEKIRGLGLSEIIEGRLLEIIRDRKSANQDLAEAEKDLTNSRIENNEKELDSRIEAVNQEYDLSVSAIDLMKATEAEKTRLRLQAEKDRLQSILDINEAHGKTLTAMQVATMKNAMAAIDNEIKTVGKDSVDIYSVFGLDLDDDKKQAISDSISFAMSGIQELLSVQIEAANQAIAKVQEQGNALRSRLDDEREARLQGFAFNETEARRELELNEEKEKELLKQKQKYQEAQEAINTVAQASSLVTAAANIWKSLSALGGFGTGLAIAAIGTMFASFTAAKIKAKSLSKEQYGEGGLEFLNGGSHASGNDIPIGITSSGKQRTAEGGEAMAIINKKRTAKYRSVLPSIINSLNAGTFERHFGKTIEENASLNNISINGSGKDMNLSTIENNLSEINKRGQEQVYTDSRGRMVVKYKNVTTIHAV